MPCICAGKAYVKMSSTATQPTIHPSYALVTKWGFTRTQTNNQTTNQQNQCNPTNTTQSNKNSKQLKAVIRKKQKQTFLTDTNYKTKEIEYYGDNPYKPCPRSHFHIVGGNLQGIPIKRNNAKNKILFDFIKESNSQIVAIQETRIDPRLIQSRHGWYERLRDSRMGQVKTSWANNITAPPLNSVQAAILAGGTMVLSIGSITSHRPTPNSDPTGLGRWTSLQIQGPSGYAFRLVSAYFPCSNSTGEETVYSQHKLRFRETKRIADLRTAMIEDLHKAIQAWTDHGKRIMIFADTNDDIRTGQLNNMFMSLNLKEHISEKHGKKRPLPNTEIHNKNNKPIDGIWSNIPDLNLDCGYYTFFDAFQSDHPTMWIRIPIQTLLGHRPPHIH